jgi:hypothetical protein
MIYLTTLLMAQICAAIDHGMFKEQRISKDV